MVFITDDDHMVSGEAFFLYDTVYLQNERTGDIYIGNTFFFQFIVDWFSYTMGTDHHNSTAQLFRRSIDILFADHLYTL